MRIAQMEAREPYLETLYATLTAGWSEQFGHVVTVDAPGSGTPTATAVVQQWHLQPLLSSYITERPTAAVRRFLGDSFRFTPHRERAIPQWFAATTLTTGLGLLVGTRPGFVVTPELPNARDMLVVPGNQRIRVFDFASGRTRVFLKTGFSAASMLREINVRSGAGPFLPVLANATDGTWLEEPLIDAWSLPRCPPWVNDARALNDAVRQLEGWLLQTAEVVTPSDWADERLGSIESLLDELDARFPDPGRSLRERCATIAREARQMKALLVAQTHGDFQPGNIIVERAKDRGERRVWLIDWEHSRRRSIDYDRLTLGLGTRNAPRLAPLWERFLACNASKGGPRSLQGKLETPLGTSATAPESADERRARLAMFVLEDIEFYLQESLSGPYTQPSDGLKRHQEALSFWSHPL